MLFYTTLLRMSPAILLYASMGPVDKSKSPLAGLDVEHLWSQLGRPPDDGLLELRELDGKATSRVNVAELRDSCANIAIKSTLQACTDPWISAALSGLVTEWILLALSMVVYGTAVHFAVSHGLYHAHTFSSMPQSGRVMYVGALVYLIYACTGLYFICIPCFPTFANSTQHDEESYEHKDDDLWYRYFPRIVVANMIFGAIVGSWLFWAGFVHYAGER